MLDNRIDMNDRALIYPPARPVKVLLSFLSRSLAPR
ncbi:unnamed protein product [Dibothriocephalus latus]|uniref:Uncharacterized protein n=1 Tax=Dibothriocephalus latus TaxID=60516 RepID=A0A3P6Q9X4_DIBLA|nr:unnamed protein product [Dibothriocephalus latus]